MDFAQRTQKSRGFFSHREVEVAYDDLRALACKEVGDRAADVRAGPEHECNFLLEPHALAPRHEADDVLGRK